MTSVNDANIPVLTEIIEPVAETVTTTIAVSEPLSVVVPYNIPVLDTPLMQSEKLAAEALTTTPSKPELDWDAMELTVREAVLKQVLTRVDFVLEHRVRDGLADVLQTAVDKLADEIRTGLANSLNELVTRSVQQELLKIRSGKQ